MNRPLLTASLIVKNEEKFLGTCLDSLQGVVDEMVVVDTGSTDGTKQLAVDHGAALHDFEWTGDFSAARNRALELSHGDWILYIDADERVRPDSVSGLRAELLDPNYIGYEVLLHPRPGHTPFWILRLFKNDSSIRFRGIIHENIWPALTEYHAQHGGKIAKSKLALDHEGYEGDQEIKNSRNFPLLLKALEQDPTRIYSWCHLANIHAARNERQLAEEAWRKALGIVRARSTRMSDDILPYLGLIESGIDSGGDVADLLEEALRRFGPRVQLRWLKGRLLMRDGCFLEAIAVFQGLVALGQNGTYDRFSSHDLKLFNVCSYDAIATCHFRLGNYDESRHYSDLAARCEPERLEHRIKRALSERLSARRTKSLESA